MALTSKQKSLFEENDYDNYDQESNGMREAAITDYTKFWENGLIPYEFSVLLDDQRKADIQREINHMNRKYANCINFV